ncbi:MAG: DUF4870 domain-containing protein [Tepidisphaeraceae bacterium]
MTEGNEIPPPPPPPSDPAAGSPAGAGAPAPGLPYQTPGSTGYPGPYVGPAPTKDDNTMAMLCHLLSIFTGFLGPLIIWLIKKDQSPFVDDQGKEALNFQLTLLIGYIVGVVTACLIIGYLLIMAVWVVSIIFAIMGTIAANKGVAYRYPINIRFIK